MNKAEIARDMLNDLAKAFRNQAAQFESAAAGMLHVPEAQREMAFGVAILTAIGSIETTKHMLLEGKLDAIIGQTT